MAVPQTKAMQAAIVNAIFQSGFTSSRFRMDHCRLARIQWTMPLSRYAGMQFSAPAERKAMRGFFLFGCAQGQNDKQEQANTKYRDSGFARMTSKNRQRRELIGRKGRAAEVMWGVSGSFDCVWRKSAPNSAQDDRVNRVTGSLGARAVALTGAKERRWRGVGPRRVRARRCCAVA